MGFAGGEWRVEQGQQFPSASILKRVKYRTNRGHRMEHPRRRLVTEALRDSLPDPLHILNQSWPVMSPCGVAGIAPVMAEVEQDNFVATPHGLMTGQLWLRIWSG